MMNTEREPLTGNPTLVDRKWNRFNVVNLTAYTINLVITYGYGEYFLADLPKVDEVSRKYQTLVTPVGWAFSIWGIIFTTQAIWVLRQLVVPSERNNPMVAAVGFRYCYAVLAQVTWIFAFTFEQITLSTLIIAILCAVLWSIVFTLKKSQSDLGSSSPLITVSSYLLWWFPFTIHAGWITAATTVSLNIELVAQQTLPTIQYTAAVISLVVLFILATTLIIKKFDKTIPLVLAWALLGVFSELQFSQDESISARFSTNQLRLAKYGSIVLSILIVGLTLVFH